MLAGLTTIDEPFWVFRKITGHATLEFALVNLGVADKTVASHLSQKHPLRVSTHMFNVLLGKESIYADKPLALEALPQVLHSILLSDVIVIGRGVALKLRIAKARMAKFVAIVKHVLRAVVLNNMRIFDHL
jgi:hypothetical protein